MRAFVQVVILKKNVALTGKPEPQRQHLFDAELFVPQNRVKSNCNKMTLTRLCLLLSKNKRLALER